ncbi:MAG: hypothetical protein B7Z52_05140 [Burkholderiales bacterium 12-64-5]|nr:MAG: hypothetical protein B7Z52_05140 [Burkholderiales bacterium 12-64-5]
MKAPGVVIAAGEPAKSAGIDRRIGAGHGIADAGRRPHRPRDRACSRAPAFVHVAPKRQPQVAQPALHLGVGGISFAFSSPLPALRLGFGTHSLEIGTPGGVGRRAVRGQRRRGIARAADVEQQTSYGAEVV